MDERLVVVAVECDFRGYRPYDGGCRYDHAQSVGDVASALELVRDACGGKAAFFAHTSVYLRREHKDPFYTHGDYLKLWKQVQDGGGEIGLHPHEEEPDGSCFYYYYSGHMARVIGEHAQILRGEGLAVNSQMMGYFGMNEWLTPIVEESGLTCSLNNVGKYVRYSHNNWTGASPKPYFHSYDDVLSPGGSSVLEIPLGTTELMRYEDGLVPDANSLWDLKRVWRGMEAEGRLWPCFVLLRTSEMWKKRSTARKFLKYLRSNGAVFVTPSEVYARFAEKTVGLEARV